MGELLLHAGWCRRHRRGRHCHYSERRSLVPQHVLAKRGRGGHALDGLGRHGCGGQVEREAEREVEIHRGRQFLEVEQRGVAAASTGEWEPSHIRCRRRAQGVRRSHS